MSSLAFFGSILLISFSEDSALDDVVSTAGVYLALLLFGAFVLVPHIPIKTKTWFKVLFLVCLPILLVWTLVILGEALSMGLERMMDRYIPYTVWVWMTAVAGGAWILCLAYATLRTAKLDKTNRFWRYVLLVASVVTILIFAALISFCLFSCSEWNEPVMAISSTLLLLITPIGLTTALQFGTETR